MSVRALLRSEFVPFSVKRAFREALQPAPAEQVLWREVIVRATLDAFGDATDTCKGETRQELMDDARLWFEREYDTVQLYFDLAGVEVAPIMKALEECIKTEGR